MLEDVFILYHTYGSDDEEDENWKELGVYSSSDEANKAIQRFTKQPGFKDYPDGFVVDKHKLNANSPGWAEGFITWEEDLQSF